MYCLVSESRCIFGLIRFLGALNNKKILLKKFLNNYFNTNFWTRLKFQKLLESNFYMIAKKITHIFTKSFNYDTWLCITHEIYQSMPKQ